MTIATRWLKAGGRDVPLLAGPGALSALPGALTEVGFEGRLFVVADAYAMDLHKELFGRVVNTPDILCISGQESDKTLAEVSKVWDWLVDRGAHVKVPALSGRGSWRSPG